MSNITHGKIFWDNKLTTENVAAGKVAVTVTTEAPTWTKKYLFDKNPASCWRSTAITTQYITISFAAATEIKGIVIMNHNLVQGDIFVFEVSTTSNFSTIIISQAIDPTKSWIELTSNNLYYRVKMAKTSGSYIYVGEIFLFAGAYEFEDNFYWGYSKEIEMSDLTSNSTAGQIYRSIRYKRANNTYPFPTMSDNQQLTFETIAGFPFSVFLPYGANGTLLYGTAKFAQFVHISPNNWSTTMTFKESPK